MYTLAVDPTIIFHTGDPHIIDFGTVNTNITIGKFCLFGPNLTILAGGSEHYSKGVAIRPDRPLTKGDVKIGNGVWTGYNVTIFSGVTIGDGAIIGACSVVSKNIPSYAVAVGNPIRVIKYRFDPETIEKLLKIAWWNRGNQFIDENSFMLYDEKKVQLFIKRCGL